MFNTYSDLCSQILTIHAREMEKSQENLEKRNVYKVCFDIFELGTDSRTELGEEDEFPVSGFRREGIPESWTNERESSFAK